MRVMSNNAEDILEQDVLLGDELLDDEESLSGPSDEMYEHFSIVVDKGQKMLRLDKFLVDRMEHPHVVVSVLHEDISDTHTSCNTCVVVIEAQHDLSDVLVDLQPMKDRSLGYGA